MGSAKAHELNKLAVSRMPWVRDFVLDLFDFSSIVISPLINVEIQSSEKFWID
jgi:hypothetical protein